LRYTMPGDHRRLDLPEFPSQPAVQKVYLCAYIPRELTLLRSDGPWTDEMEWRWYEALNTTPFPHRTDGQLTAWVIEGLSVPNPAEDFVTDGRLYTFSTLQPAPPPDGSLRLVAVDETVFHWLVFAVVVVLGLLLIPRPLSNKFAAVPLLVAFLLAAGVFLPTFSRQVMDGALLTAILIVLAAWLVWHVWRAWPHVVAALSRKRAAEETADGAEQPADRTTESGSSAESPFGNEKKDDGDTTAEESADNIGREPTEDQQEGGRDDA